MLQTLSQLLTEPVIRREADPEAYRRGREYYMRGHVESVENFEGGIRASVRGRFDYIVTLAAVNGALKHHCDCPMGKEGDFCKHCVAASLAWLQIGAVRRPPKQITMADAAKRLAEEPSTTLARMIVEWAKDDGVLRQRLLHYAARRAGPKTAIAAARAAFEKAASPRRHITGREATAFARDIGRAIDVFEELFKEGHAAPVIDLCEAGLRQIAGCAGMVHDDGEMRELTERLEAIHFHACLEARPDPDSLGTRLFELAIDENINGFHRAAEKYAEVLGDAGLLAFKSMAESPAFSRNYRITGIRESVARAAGSIDWLIAMYQQDLSSASRYARIANACLEAKRYDEALAWVGKGLAAFPKDFELREVAAAEYHRRGQHSDAVKLMWAAYTEDPCLRRYQKLKHHAEQAADWPEWRDNAIGLVRQRMASVKGKADHSLLVEIFLDDDQAEEAWSEAQKGGCAAHHWLTLAEVREKEHPGDAAPIYLRQVETELSRIGNGNYNNPVALLIRMAAVMKRIGASAEFARQLDALRFKYRVKRNFIKLLDKRRGELSPT